MDIDSNPKYGEIYSGDGTPTLKLFKKEKKDDMIEEYEESRELPNLIEWLK